MLITAPGKQKAIRKIFSRIDSIGSPEQNFTFGVVERGKGIQYIESIGVLYASPNWYLEVEFDDLSGPALIEQMNF